MFLEGQTGCKALGLQHMRVGANVLQKSLLLAYPKVQFISSLIGLPAKTRALLRKLLVGSSKVAGREVDKDFGVGVIGMRMARE